MDCGTQTVISRALFKEPNMYACSLILYLYIFYTLQYSPVAPFGGTDDFDVSTTHIVYTAKDPQLPEAWHTKQNVRGFSFCNYKRILTPLNRYTLFLLTAKTNPSSLRPENKAPRMHQSSIPKGPRLPGWSSIRMDMNLIGADIISSINHKVLMMTFLSSAKIVIYDLEKQVRFTVTQSWDRSPDALAVITLRCYIWIALTISCSSSSLRMMISST